MSYIHNDALPYHMFFSSDRQGFCNNYVTVILELL